MEPMDRDEVLLALAGQDSERAAVDAAYEQLGAEEGVAYAEVYERFGPRWRALEDDTEGMAGTRDAFDELEAEEILAYRQADQPFDARHDDLEARMGRLHFLSQVIMFEDEPLHVTTSDSHGPQGILLEVNSFPGHALARHASVFGPVGGFRLGVALKGFEDHAMRWCLVETLEQARRAACQWAARGIQPPWTEIPQAEGYSALTQIQDELIPF
jgi:hypothetical protein